MIQETTKGEFYMNSMLGEQISSPKYGKNFVRKYNDNFYFYIRKADRYFITDKLRYATMLMCSRGGEYDACMTTHNRKCKLEMI
jgi:hypothetical protein